MEPLVILLVLCAAIMHAVWNSILKLGTDRLMTMAVVFGMGGLLSPLLIVAGPPPLPESWIFILLSAAIHCLYFFFLVQAYEIGDLSHVYPLARGSAPLMVAAGAALFAGELLSPFEIFAVVLVSAGIISLMLAGPKGAYRGNWRTLAYPLLTGLMIAAYTVADGLGVRLSGNPASYIGWLFLLSALPIMALAIHRRRAGALDFLRSHWKPAMGGGVLAFSAYSLAIWALSLGAMVHVSALRETSVVIAALIGTRLLGEPYGARRVLSAATVAGGVILLHLAA
ncbi:MAG: EamA family transporter [Alphaproteobacteria bacterium]